MSDFEIEGSNSDFELSWAEEPRRGSRSPAIKPQPKPVTKKSVGAGLFGGGGRDEDNDGYDFEVTTDYGKGGRSKRSSPNRSSYSPGKDKAGGQGKDKGAGKGGIVSKSTSAVGALAKDGDAMARASEMLARYASNGTGTRAPAGAPRHKTRLPESYEDDISLDSGDSSGSSSSGMGGAAARAKAKQLNGTGASVGTHLKKESHDDFSVEISVGSDEEEESRSGDFEIEDSRQFDHLGDESESDDDFGQRLPSQQRPRVTASTVNSLSASKRPPPPSGPPPSGSTAKPPSSLGGGLSRSRDGHDLQSLGTMKTVMFEAQQGNGAKRSGDSGSGSGTASTSTTSSDGESANSGLIRSLEGNSAASPGIDRSSRGGGIAYSNTGVSKVPSMQQYHAVAVDVSSSGGGSDSDEVDQSSDFRRHHRGAVDVGEAEEDEDAEKSSDNDSPHKNVVSFADLENLTAWDGTPAAETNTHSPTEEKDAVASDTRNTTVTRGSKSDRHKDKEEPEMQWGSATSNTDSSVFPQGQGQGQERVGAQFIQPAYSSQEPAVPTAPAPQQRGEGGGNFYNSGGQGQHNMYRNNNSNAHTESNSQSTSQQSPYSYPFPYPHQERYGGAYPYAGQGSAQGQGYMPHQAWGASAGISGGYPQSTSYDHAARVDVTLASALREGLRASSEMIGRASHVTSSTARAHGLLSSMQSQQWSNASSAGAGGGSQGTPDSVQAVVLDLLLELRQAKAEAAASRGKLQEIISSQQHVHGQQKSTSGGGGSSRPRSRSRERSPSPHYNNHHNNLSGHLSAVDGDDGEYDDDFDGEDYSQDFESATGVSAADLDISMSVSHASISMSDSRTGTGSGTGRGRSPGSAVQTAGTGAGSARSGGVGISVGVGLREARDRDVSPQYRSGGAQSRHSQSTSTAGGGGKSSIDHTPASSSTNSVAGSGAPPGDLATTNALLQQLLAAQLAGPRAPVGITPMVEEHMKWQQQQQFEQFQQQQSRSSSSAVLPSASLLDLSSSLQTHQLLFQKQLNGLRSRLRGPAFDLLGGSGPSPGTDTGTGTGTDENIASPSATIPSPSPSARGAATPSLAAIKSMFEERRSRDLQSVRALLRKVDPNITV